MLTSTQGIPKQELIDVDLGEHFHLEIAFDTTKFEFKITYNGGEMDPYVVPTAKDFSYQFYQGCCTMQTIISCSSIVLSLLDPKS